MHYFFLLDGCLCLESQRVACLYVHRIAEKNSSRKLIFRCGFFSENPSSTAGCTVIEPTSLAVHTSLLRKPPEQALVCSKCCGSTALQTAVRNRLKSLTCGPTSAP